MATINHVFEGIKIIKKYLNEHELNRHDFQAEHDQFWCGDYSADKMTTEDREKMTRLGWFEDEGAWSLHT